MKALMPIERVVDRNVRIREQADGSGVDGANIRLAMNRFDGIAVEEPIRLKDAGAVSASPRPPQWEGLAGRRYRFCRRDRRCRCDYSGSGKPPIEFRPDRRQRSSLGTSRVEGMKNVRIS